MMCKRHIKKIGIFNLGDMRVAVHPLDMGELLAKDGFQVDIFMVRKKELLEYHNKRGFRIIRLRLSRENKDSARFRSTEFLLKALIKCWGHYDLAIGVDEVGYVLARILKKIGRAKMLVYYALELSLPKEHKGNFYVWHQKLFAKEADIVIATGEDRADIMKEEFKLRNSPLVIKNCPLYIELNKNNYLRNVLNERGYNLEKDFIVIYQGGLNSDRCVLEMISSVEMWALNYALVILGYGEQKYIKEIEKEIKNNKFKDRIFYLGWIPGSREELLRLTCGANLGISFHRWRDLNLAYATYWTPGKIYDYLACGIPTVASDNPSLKFIEEEGWGICVNPEDPQHIAMAVNKILGNQTLYNKMCENAKELFKEKYNYQKQLETFLTKLNANLIDLS